MKSLTRELEGKMKLKVNEAKSAVRYCTKTKFLGFTFYIKSKGKAVITPHQKSRNKFKEKVRELLKRNKGQSIEAVVSKLNLFLTGWVSYYAVSEMKAFIDEMAGWIRRKIRVYVWNNGRK